MSANQPNIDETVIGGKTHIVGDLNFASTLQLQGQITGKVVALDEQGTAIISGVVKGHVTAPNVVISGTVDGDVHASKRLRLEAGARVTGRVVCRTIDMQLNASLQGQLTVDPKLIPASPAKTA